MKNINSDTIICWWSGGITSAVACKIAVDMFGGDNCHVIFIDTKNEHDDTYRFKKDCEDWYGIEIESIWNPKYQNIREVWRKFKGMNFAYGAICSSELKKNVRLKWEKENPNFKNQVFGFDFSAREFRRAMSVTLNYPKAKAIYPLLMRGIDKKGCLEIIQEAGIEVPESYKMGFHNNNCLKTGCVQGKIGYWTKFRQINPKAFEEMALLEHELTNEKGRPVTINKDQSGKEKGFKAVFLLPHPDYPDYKDISKIKGRKVESLMPECNGLCATNDLDNINDVDEKGHKKIPAQQTLFDL